MKPVKKIVATTGKTSKGKAVYSRIGTMFERDDGSLAIKIESLPVGCPEWTGWANLYDMDPPKDDKQPTGGGEISDEIPFAPETR